MADVKDSEKFWYLGGVIRGEYKGGGVLHGIGVGMVTMWCISRYFRIGGGECFQSSCRSQVTWVTLRCYAGPPDGFGKECGITEMSITINLSLMEKVGPRDPKKTSREWGEVILNKNNTKQLDDDLFPQKRSLNRRV